MPKIQDFTLEVRDPNAKRITFVTEMYARAYNMAEICFLDTTQQAMLGESDRIILLERKYSKEDNLDLMAVYKENKLHLILWYWNDGVF